MTRGDAATGSQLAGRPKAEPRSYVVDLSDGVATDPSLTGGKAAALARAQIAGLRTLGGVVLTTAFCKEIDAGASVAGHPAVREAFERAGGDERDLVARSSSVVEDTAESSTASTPSSRRSRWCWPRESGPAPPTSPSPC
jgi:rifampicin phosphotransferase